MEKIVSRLLVIISLCSLVISCDNEEFVADASGDAFIVSKLTGTGLESDTVYGLALHAFGNKSFSAVTATSPDNTTFTIQSYNGFTYDYYYETDEDGFVANLPAAGNYSFACSFTTGEAVNVVDQLTDDVIYPVNITRAAYNAAEAQIELEWTSAEDDVDYYVVFMENEDGDVVYVSHALAGSLEKFEISGSTYTWVNGETPENGQAYTISVNAYMYEAADGTDLNVQAKSIATTTVVWNPAD